MLEVILQPNLNKELSMKVFNRLFVGGGLILATSFVSNLANAADGCKFMLCMGAVNPMGIAECKPVIKEVLRDLKKGKGFPTCKMSDGQDSKSSGSFVTHARATYTPRCPAGMMQGQNGVVYHSGAMPKNIRYSPFTGYNNLPKGGASNVLLDDDDMKIFARGDNLKQRVCVGGKSSGSLAARTVNRGGDNDTVIPAQQWYDKVQVMKPDGASYEFTFYVDNKIFSQHRF